MNLRCPVAALLPVPADSLSGFLLTRNWRDAPAGTELEYWLATAHGAVQVLIPGQPNVAFVEAQHHAAVQAAVQRLPGASVKPLALRSFQGQPVLGIYTTHYRTLRQLARALQPQGIALLEADVRPHERFLMERFITAGVTLQGGQWEEAPTSEDASGNARGNASNNAGGDPSTATSTPPRYRICRNPTLRPAPTARPALKVVALDIETSADHALYSIALHTAQPEDGGRVVFMLHDSGTPPTEAPSPTDFALHYLPSRAALIGALNDWMAQHDPDVLIGWNVLQFDLRVLQLNADAAHTPLLLGRGRTPLAWRAHPGKQAYWFAPMPGRVVLDGIEALRAAMWSFASFRLEDVAQQLLGEGKTIGDAYDKLAEIERRFQHDQPALASYNLHDCALVLRIFEHAQLLPFAMERAHTTGLQLDHFGGSIAAFSHHYLPRMHRLGYVAPSVGDVQGKSSPGGYVMDSLPGFYDNVLVLDYKSLYPSIIRTFLVDPVGLVTGMVTELVAGQPADPHIHTHTPAPAAAPPAADTPDWWPYLQAAQRNEWDGGTGATVAADHHATPIHGPLGTQFSRSQHALPGIVTTLWQARDAAKRANNEPLSQALKLVMNSFAGVLGSAECRFFNPLLISAITLRGHAIVKTTRALVEQRGYQAIYGDTDSIFVWLKTPHTNAQAHAVAAQLVADINVWWANALQREQGLHSYLEIEFDTHFHKFFMPTIRGSDVGSKKRYAGLSVDAAGREAMVFRGLEMARSDWTLLARQFQDGLLSRVFHGTPYRDYVRDTVAATLTGQHDADLVYRKRLRHPLDAYVRNVPPQVRAARLADAHHQRLGRPAAYQHGGWIEYVMTVHGPQPLEARNAPLDYGHYLSKQLQPIADAILGPLGDSFADVISPQRGLF